MQSSSPPYVYHFTTLFTECIFIKLHLNPSLAPLISFITLIRLQRSHSCSVPTKTETCKALLLNNAWRLRATQVRSFRCIASAHASCSDLYY